MINYNLFFNRKNIFMKKNLIILVVAILAIGLFYACKKNTDHLQTTTSNEKQYSAYELDVIHKLKTFRNTLKNGIFTGKPKSLDSAKWYIETYFNVVKARTEEPYKLLRKDTTYYTLPINKTGLIEYSSMNAMYDKMVSDLDSLEIVIADPNIIPIFARLIFLSSNSSNAQYMMILGGGSYYSGNYAPFYEDDDWKFGNMQGHCDGSNATQSDAGQELKYRLNHPLFDYSPGSFVDPQTYPEITFSGYPDVNNLNPDPNCHYMLFYEERTVAQGPPCLENEELTFYLNRAHEIFYTFQNQLLPNTTTEQSLYGKRPVGKYFVEMTLWTPSGTAQNGKLFWEHRYTPTYAFRVNLPDEF